MPSTVIGALVFIACAAPGFFYTQQRRRQTELPVVSAVSETAALVVVSLMADLVGLAAFGVIRTILPHNTPDVGQLAAAGHLYIAPRVAYVTEWGVGVLAFSCLIGWLMAFRPSSSSDDEDDRDKKKGRIRSWIRLQLTPTIVQQSAWDYAFTAAGNLDLYLTCYLKDGSVIGGYADWWSTQLQESTDRDLVLVAPITVTIDGTSNSVEDADRLIVSAREIHRIFVRYLEPSPDL